VRTTFAVGLQLGRAFVALVGIVTAIRCDDRRALHRCARRVVDAVLAGARDRGRGKLVRSLVDQQRRTAPLTRLRPSRKGRGPQAIAARRRARGDKVNA
jgi:hypothetical protein